MLLPYLIKPSPYRVNYCPGCTIKRPAQSTGPAPSRVMVIGEAPGPEEDKGYKFLDWLRVPWIGKSGEELTLQYLPMAGLSRPEVYCTNALKCYISNLEAGDARVAACALAHLEAEIRQVQPEVIVTLGAVATFVLAPGLSLELDHGIPRQHTYGHWSGTLFATYHPAYGLREAAIMRRIQEDMQTLRLFLHGVYTRPVDAWVGKETYIHATHPDDIEQILAIDPRIGGLFMDTEHLTGDMAADGRPIAIPYCMSACTTPGQALMIMADDTRMLTALMQWYHRQLYRPLVWAHWMQHDSRILLPMGLNFPEDRRRCTMSQAYHLGGATDQALKILAYRLCGMFMREYEDVVNPHALLSIMDWFSRAAETQGGVFVGKTIYKPKQATHTCRRSKVKQVYTFNQPGEWVSCPTCDKTIAPKSIEEDPRFLKPWQWASQVFSDGLFSDDTVSKWYARLTKSFSYAAYPWTTHPDAYSWLRDEIGAPARPGLDMVPMKELVWYSCRDADAACRVHIQLTRMGRKQQRMIHPREVYV